MAQKGTRCFIILSLKVGLVDPVYLIEFVGSDCFCMKLLSATVERGKGEMFSWQSPFLVKQGKLKQLVCSSLCCLLFTVVSHCNFSQYTTTEPLRQSFSTIMHYSEQLKTKWASKSTRPLSRNDCSSHVAIFLPVCLFASRTHAFPPSFFLSLI